VSKPKVSILHVGEQTLGCDKIEVDHGDLVLTKLLHRSLGFVPATIEGLARI
jgi:hypothetical protein